MERKSYHWKDLQKYLAGLEPDMKLEFFMLAEVVKYQVLELYIEKKKDLETCFYIPYMMNDAVECYLILKHAEITGEYYQDMEEEIQAQLIAEESRYVLIVYQGTRNVFTLWFTDIQKVCNCYQYHQIGHFWVKGQEQWRQLVYMIGTIYDKYEYLGETVCNQSEVEILHLMEFAPFRYWSPICDSLDEKYPATYEGIACMEQMAVEAGDRNYQRLLNIYRRFPTRWMENLLSSRLLHFKREKLYQVIFDKVEKASQRYPKRDYGEKRNQQMQEKRRKADQLLKEKGFQGTYPIYQKGKIIIQAAEEHPFTILESENFKFRIQLMVSECYYKNAGRNSGFFKGKGRKGWIQKI